MKPVNDLRKQKLTPEEYHILRERGTEPAFSGKYYNSKERGTFVCAACKNPLFSSESKYDSGSGWPSFYKPLHEENIRTRPGASLGSVRTEVLCASCESHLGHVFEDGPEPTGKRFCINSVALKLNEKTDETS